MLVVIVVILAIVLPKDKQDVAPTTDPVQEEESMTEESQEGEAMSDKNTGTHSIEESSSVTYVVQKEFVGKPTQEVRGVTNAISGTISYDDTTKMLDTKLVVDPALFDSGAKKRDNDIAELFGGNFVIDVPTLEILNDTTGIIQVPVIISLGEVSVEVIADLAVTIDGDIITAEGVAPITISSFIEAPSAAGVYSVADDAQVEFKIEATKS